MTNVPAPELAQEFRRHLSRQANLCDRLERLADELPDALNVRESLYLAQCLLPTVILAHRFEEDSIFPLLRQGPQDLAMIFTLDRLRYEHMGDEGYAGDIALNLRTYVAHRRDSNAETLGWMLRGFFEAVRRHIAFEREHILPLLDGKMTPLA